MPAISEAVPATADDTQEDVNAGTLQPTDINTIIGNTSKPWATGWRFTTIGPSAGDTIDDANLRFGINSENWEGGAEGGEFHTDLASSAAWAATSGNRPSEITHSTNFGFKDGTGGNNESDATADVTDALQEWVDDGDYDGNVRFSGEGNSALENWDHTYFSATGAGTWLSSPQIPVLEGNYTTGGGSTFIPRVMVY